MIFFFFATYECMLLCSLRIGFILLALNFAELDFYSVFFCKFAFFEHHNWEDIFVLYRHGLFMDCSEIYHISIL